MVLGMIRSGIPWDGFLRGHSMSHSLPIEPARKDFLCMPLFSSSCALKKQRAAIDWFFEPRLVSTESFFEGGSRASRALAQDARFLFMVVVGKQLRHLCLLWFSG